MLFNTISYAVIVITKQLGDQTSTDNIEVNYNLKGLFKSISYTITDTGASSGIRYRTNQITFDINGMKGSIDAIDIANIKPAPGQTIVSVIIIEFEDIKEALIKTAQKNGDYQLVELLNNDDYLRELLKDPKNIEIGAVIEIYNASTGEHLDWIRNEDEVEKIAGEHGFSSKSIEDIKTEFKKHHQDPITAMPDPEPSPGQDNDLQPGTPPGSGNSSGLRRTILLYE